MPCSYKWRQVASYNSVLRSLGLNSFTSSIPGVAEINALRSELIAQVTGPFPRISTLIWQVLGLSEGYVRVWFENERGWFAEGHKTPGAPPEYHALTTEEALRLVSPDPDKELAHKLMEHDAYAGE